MAGPRLKIVDHPAVADRLARLRDRTTPGFVFRRLVEELGEYLAYEATSGLALRGERVTTPLEETDVRRISGRPVVAPILRAGLGLLPGFLAVIDDAVVAHLGFYRDPKTLAAIPYYANCPDDLSGREVFVLDPMLATGHSGAAALGALAGRGARDATFICIIAAPEGVEELTRAQPTCRIVTAALDR
ncbi:MAG: uracil phosphoribosyltransferase, partial [Candidatus Eremiobacteraeota bacterium]|nr:uracil phosphoribosyltransferase [Candidatus Eremiobacteraeota bacterium]